MRARANAIVIMHYPKESYVAVSQSKPNNDSIAQVLKSNIEIEYSVKTRKRVYSLLWRVDYCRLLVASYTSLVAVSRHANPKYIHNWSYARFVAALHGNYFRAVFPSTSLLLVCYSIFYCYSTCKPSMRLYVYCAYACVVFFIAQQSYATTFDESFFML